VKAIIREINTEYSNDALMRLNATAAVKVLADLFSEETYADICTITMDYRGYTGDEPVVYIEMVKFMPEFAPANIQPESLILDMREWFGDDRVDHNLLRQVVSEMGTVINDIVAAGPPPLVAARSTNVVLG
jgi:hypothetical protein